MKTLRKTIAVLLAALLAAALCVCAFAGDEDEGVVLSGTAGSGITWTLTEDGVLTVSGSGPIEDELQYEYDDDEEISGSEKLSSVSMTILAYLETQTEGMDITAAEQLRFDLVRQIVIEEGITSIPVDEFEYLYPRTVSLPSSLKELGYNAFNATYAQSVTFGGDLESAQFTIGGYRTDSEPYADLDAAIGGYFEKCVKEAEFQANSMPIYALQEIFSIKHGLVEVTDEDLASILEFYNGEIGIEAASIDELCAFAIDFLNSHYGTDHTSVDDFFRIEENEWGQEVCFSDELQELYQAEADSIFEDGRMVSLSFGENSFEDVKAYTWLTVTAPSDSTIEKNCSAAGIPFIDLYEGLCKYCHQDHSGNIWQRFVGFIHKILYFFAHLFGLK